MAEYTIVLAVIITGIVLTLSTLGAMIGTTSQSIAGRIPGARRTGSAQTGLNASKGCRQPSQYQIARQAVGPKLFSRRVAVEPQ